MLIERITSRQNPLVKRFRRVRVGGERHQLLLEGVRIIGDALEAGVHFETVAFSPTLESTELGRALLDRLQRVRCRGALVTPQVMEAIADTESPQGVAAIVTRPVLELADLPVADRPLLVIADQLQDPGNLGTIIRTAEAAGATAMICTRQSVDPFNSKAVRASMGSCLRLPICTDVKPADAIEFCRKRDIKLVATRSSPAFTQMGLSDAAAAPTVKVFTDVDMTGRLAVVMGREASGVSSSFAREAHTAVYVPMAEGVESLNVAAAASILLYEAARQRGFDFGTPKERAKRKSPGGRRRTGKVTHET